MPEVPIRHRDVAHELLQGDDVRKAVVALALPYQLFVDFDGEHAAGTWHQGHRPQFGTEGVQQLRCHP
ncbi:hypothetical protein W823_10650 [Williamsia sp. D3]|nr:hypothetical protein W823_10650 [Williamsia sp. D3]